jgi:hypothetical protein
LAGYSSSNFGSWCIRFLRDSASYSGYCETERWLVLACAPRGRVAGQLRHVLFIVDICAGRHDLLTGTSETEIERK